MSNDKRNIKPNPSFSLFSLPSTLSLTYLLYVEERERGLCSDPKWKIMTVW